MTSATTYLKLPAISSRPRHTRSSSASSISHPVSDIPPRPQLETRATSQLQHVSQGASSLHMSPHKSPSSERAGPPPPNTSKARSRTELEAVDNHPSHPTTSLPSKTTLLAGRTGKSFIVHSDLLISRSPYFRELILPHQDHLGRHASNSNLEVPFPGISHNTISYPDLDEFAFGLFFRWLYGAHLAGPTDFYTMQHYTCLYVLASKFRIEKLQNQVTDLIRHYYRSANVTAPPYRLKYIYENTSGENKMRSFLVETAAYKALCEGTLSEGMAVVVRGGGDLAVDFLRAVISLHGVGSGDVRLGGDCQWHVHKETKVCEKDVSDP